MEILLKEIIGYLMALTKSFESKEEKEEALAFSREMLKIVEPMMKNANINLLQMAHAVGTFHAAVLSEIIEHVEDLRKSDEAAETAGNGEVHE